VAANLLTDDYLMRSYQLTPEYRPLVDYHADLAPIQGNKGWRFGYSDALLDTTADFQQLQYFAHASGQLPDGRWTVSEVGNSQLHSESVFVFCIQRSPLASA
jgi:hypothetical protein